MPRARSTAQALLPLAIVALAGCLAAPEPAPTSLDASGTAGMFSTTAVFEGTYDIAGPYARPLLAGAYEILTPEVVSLESDVDGAAIQMGIVRPDVPEGTRVPVIVDASPYFDPMDPERVRENPKNDQVTFWTFNHYDYYVTSFVPHGYAVVFLAMRGTGDSGGCEEEIGPGQQADINQAITWLGEQPWSNGNVGMAGISYEALTQWSAASKGNRYLKTIVPIGSSPDFFQFVVKNGTYAPLGTLLGPWFYLYGAGVDPVALATDPASAGQLRPLDGRSPEHRLEGVACPERAKVIAASAHAQATLERDPLGVFDARDFRPGIRENYRGSVFLVNGFREFDVNMMATYNWIGALEARGVVVKHLLGQWDHAYPDYRIFRGDTAASALFGISDDTHKRWDFAEILLRWFDRWLKEDASVDIGPRAQAQDNLGLWRSERAWPPADAEPMQFYLAEDGMLAPAASDTRTSLTLCGHAGTLGAPLPCAARARFESAPFEREFRFAGLPTMHVTVTPTGPGGHVAGVLLVAGPDGEQRVGAGELDLRVADGTGQPRAVAAGAPVVARMQAAPLEVVVPAGSRLVLEVTAGTTLGGIPGVVPAPVDLAVGGDASVLTVMAFERGPEAFFTPPGVDA